MRDQAVRSRHFSQLKVTVIENPIDPSFFLHFDRQQIRRELLVPEGAFVACSVAAQVNNPAKRIKNCIEAFSSACETSGTLGIFILVGEGSDELARQYPIAISVGPGGPGHVARALAASDVLLSGSIAESAGMTIREASAQGVLSIAVSNGGSDQMVRDSHMGFVVSDFEELKTKLTSLMSSSESVSLEFKSHKAIELAKAKAGLENVSRQYEVIYNQFGSDKVAGT
jgi:glycosyltransferase involved in cell wall biosynthesis